MRNWEDGGRNAVQLLSFVLFLSLEHYVLQVLLLLVSGGTIITILPSFLLLLFFFSNCVKVILHSYTLSFLYLLFMHRLLISLNFHPFWFWIGYFGPFGIPPQLQMEASLIVQK